MTGAASEGAASESVGVSAGAVRGNSEGEPIMAGDCMRIGAAKFPEIGVIRATVPAKADMGANSNNRTALFMVASSTDKVTC